MLNRWLTAIYRKKYSVSMQKNLVEIQQRLSLHSQNGIRVAKQARDWEIRS
jgi:hypothetical protein